MRAIPRAQANITATANAIVMAKRKADTNIATIANIMASDTKAGTNVAVNVNANKMASNIKKCVLMYRQLQMPI